MKGRRLARALVVGCCLAATLAIAGCAGWVAQSTQNPSSAGNAFRAVSCADVTDCIAVGSSDPNGNSSPLAERWDGRKWTVLPAISVPGTRSGQLSGVSCSSVDACTAVGTYVATANNALTGFAARWNGSSWTLQSIPAPAGSVGTDLHSVSCSSATSCVVVGEDLQLFGRLSAPVTLAEHWNGSTWTVEPTPHPAPDQEYLVGVSCAAPDACTAVGLYTVFGRENPLAIRWDGSSWKSQATPKPADAVAGQFEGVSCPTQVVCTAVGFSETTTTVDTLVERWSGGAWAIQASPTPTGLPSQLLGVSCPTDSRCSAVGEHLTTPTGNETTLAERWNGSTWTIEPSSLPAGSGASGRSWSASCPTSTACTAVGWWGLDTGGLRTLAQVRLDSATQAR